MLVAKRAQRVVCSVVDRSYLTRTASLHGEEVDCVLIVLLVGSPRELAVALGIGNLHLDL